MDPSVNESKSNGDAKENPSAEVKSNVDNQIVRVKTEFLVQKGSSAVSVKPEGESRDDRDRRASNDGQQKNQPVGKKRPRPELRGAPEFRLCTSVARGELCTFGESCKYAHDGLQYLSTKPADLGPICSQYESFGFCSNGLMCRFGAMHIDYVNGKSLKREIDQGGILERVQINVLSKELQSILRKKKYAGGSEFNSTSYDQKVKLVDFRNKIYIAPLTTVGNLPFRRILKDFGADITCGEMAMANNLMNGQASEWALLRRHSSEDCFGIQVAGNHTEVMSEVARVINNETTSDFVDLNCGCPIDILCDKGCGAALMTKPNKLIQIVQAMSSKLTTRQMTVKIRTGWSENDPNAHLLVPKIQAAANGRIAAIFIHGRSRLQRYHRLANWDYIAQVAKSQNKDLPLIPIIGNGDIFSYEDWAGHQTLLSEKLEGDEESIGLCSCAMIGRGALIKPWIPTEIKEKRYIDISANERLDMLKKFCSYGMEHWGSDQQGINTIRKFLLEWLSFLHRFVPLGLLEYGHASQNMSQRPPHYFGRCDLETLLASSNSKDWVRISEMLLGPVEEGFDFTAKHKTNSYSPVDNLGGGSILEDSVSNG